METKRELKLCEGAKLFLNWWSLPGVSGGGLSNGTKQIEKEPDEYAYRRIGELDPDYPLTVIKPSPLGFFVSCRIKGKESIFGAYIKPELLDDEKFFIPL